MFSLTIKCLAVQIDSSADEKSKQIDPYRLGIVLGGSVGLITAAHLQNYNSWWKGERSSFHFGEDGSYALGADKLGHFYFTFLSSDLIGHSLVWADVERQKAFLYGASIGFAFQLYVEVEDGFTKSLGFSVGDAIADVLGAFYPMLQEYDPWFQNVHFKWSMIPSEKYKAGGYNTVIDDYESQYFWLSVDRDAFPNLFRSLLPSFLSLACGYGVKHLDGSSGGERELYIGLDYDFTKLPGEGSFLKVVKHALNYIHLPAPTVRVLPSVIAYGLRF